METKKKPTLKLNRESLQQLNQRDQFLAAHGSSLWTCPQVEAEEFRTANDPSARNR